MHRVIAVALLLVAAGAARAADLPAPQTPAAPPPASLVGLGTPAVNAPGGLAAAALPPQHAIEISGYAILAGSWIQEDPNFLAVGRNNGFSLADARLEVTGRALETVWLYLSFDGAVAQRSPDNPLQGRRSVDLKDAYGIWAPGYHLRVQAGQFKAPQDIENLLEETELKFPTRSLVTDGVTPPAGYLAPGLALDRQLGIAVGTDNVALPLRCSFTAQIAVMNGNGANQLNNDTRSPSFAGRASLGLFGYAALGFDAYSTPRAFGTQPNLFHDNYTGYGADLRVEAYGFHALLLGQWRTIQHETSGAPDENATGYSAEAAYRFFFVEPAVRYSTLNPSDKIPSAAVSATTVGLNLYVPGASTSAGTARLSLAYTHRGQEPARQLTNDGFDLAAQVHF